MRLAEWRDRVAAATCSGHAIPPLRGRAKGRARSGRDDESVFRHAGISPARKRAYSPNVPVTRANLPSLICVSTKARVHLERVDGKQTITKIELDTEGDVPGISKEMFHEIAEKAKAGCPVSRALGAVNITLQAKLLA